MIGVFEVRGDCGNSVMKYLCAKKSKSFTECEKVIGGYIERTWGSPTLRVVRLGEKSNKANTKISGCIESPLRLEPQRYNNISLELCCSI